MVVIAVTGATGGVGGRVARRLSDAGVAQRLVVRDPARAPELAGAEMAVAEYGDAESVRRALDGVETLFFVSASESADRLDRHRTVVESAVAAGVPRIVYLSFLNADPQATFTLARQHHATEGFVRASGARFTFLRDGLYADFLPMMAGADRVIRGPAGGGAASVVARDDIADVAVAVLLGDGHDGLTYDITGPQALTVAEMAGELSRACGQPVSYVDETLAEAYASRAHYGAPDWQVDAWVSTYTAIASGELAAVTDTVRRVAGHDATPLAEVLRRYPDSLAHLR